MTKKWLSFMFVATTGLGCLVTPTNGGGPVDTTRSLSFVGYAGGARQLVEVSASSTREGPFGVIASTFSDARGLATGGSIRLYAFSTNAAVPNWAPVCGGQEAFIQAKANGGLLTTFDKVNASGQTLGQCLGSAVAEGANVIGAGFTCASDDSPVVRLLVPSTVEQPTSFVGDIVINNAADATSWACLQTLTGNLTVTDATLETIVMPSLISVSGDLSLEYPRPMTILPDTRAIELPLLTTVGGHVSLASHGNENHSVEAFRIGLPALATVGGDVSVLFQGFNASPTGLNALINLPGNLNIETGTGGGDSTGHSYLKFLTHVGGNVHLDLGNSVYGMLPALVAVGGDFELADGNPADNSSFGALQTIGGDLLVTNAIFYNASSYGFPALTAVTGMLSVVAVGKPNLRLGAVSGLTVGSLLVDSNPSLVIMDAAHLIVMPSGGVTISNNVNLCTSVANAWLMGLGAWAGASAISGNGPC